MIKRLLLVFLVLASVFTSEQAFAQKDFTTEAMSAFKSEAYSAAIPLLKKAFSKESDSSKKIEMIFLIAESYRNLQDFAQAETWYEKAIKAKYRDDIAQLRYAQVIKSQGRYEDALIEFKKYTKDNPSSEEGKMGEEACVQAQKWKDNPERWEVENEVLLNSKQSDFAPAFISKKGTEVIFTSTREGSAGKDLDSRSGENYSDLWKSERDKKGRWKTPEPVVELNTEANEGGAQMNEKFGVIYFTRCEDEKNKTIGCKILEARKQGKGFAAEATVLELGADSVTFGHPTLYNKDQIMVFASNLEGGFGGKDLWYITYDKRERAWSAPVNMGKEINTSGDELFPFIREDGTLFFSSNGHLGMGAMDIYQAAKIGENQWGKVENMKYPINSEANDFGLVFEPGRTDRGLFTSSRSTSRGSDDIYSFKLPPILYTIKGNITNLETGEPIAGAKIKLIGTDNSSVEIESDANGFYEFTEKPDGSRFINQNTSYTMIVEKEKHLNAKGQETTVGVDFSAEFIHDFALQPFGKEIEFPEVLYDFGKADLKPESKDSLNYLYQILVDNPNIVIELAAHTDSRGSDELNMKLSQARAKSCVDYLQSKGIDSERLMAKGYGETQLKITDEQIKQLATEEEQEAAHAKNRRTVFGVIRDDYVPKNAPPQNTETPKQDE